MNQPEWYYQLNSQQIGPVSREELESLLIQQIITLETSVWCSGMEGWQPLGNVEGFAISAGGYQDTVRPTSLTVLGILNIAFATLGLLCTPIAIISIMIPQPNSPFQMGPGMKIYTAFGAILGLVFAGVLLASGIGLLNQKNWARLAAYYYGWCSVIWGAIALIVNIITMFSALSGVSESEMPAAVGGAVGGTCGGVFGLIYPVILIIFMKKSQIVQACNR